MPFPGPNSSGGEVFGERGRCDLSPPLSLPFGFLGVQPSQADVDCPEPQEVLAKKPACSLVDKVSLGLRLPLSSPYGSGCLSPTGDGLQLAISVLSFVLCVVLVVYYVRAFCVVAIPQSGLLAQFSSLCPCMGRSSPILKKKTKNKKQKTLQPVPLAARFLKSTAGCASRSSLPSPHLLVADAGIFTAFPLGELLLGS